MKLEEKIKKAAETTLEYLKIEGSEVEIYLVSDETMHLINKKYRGKDKPTNVLSFEEPVDIPRPNTDKRHLGEIYLAPEYIRNHNDDIALLVVHGILHLLGYDHMNDKEAAVMEAKEDEVLEKAGITI